MSNFDYLMFLNNASHRSFADLTQYPIFPWVIKNWSDSKLDLNDRRIYRDLTKPIGALNPERLKIFETNYEQGEENKKYFYGSHYSSPGYVIGYLIRTKPLWIIKM